jgi:toxin ParE1/3/4
MLAEQPEMGRVRDELLQGLRSFPVARYVIFYLTVPNGIDIVRVLHGSRDVNAIFHS